MQDGLGIIKSHISSLTKDKENVQPFQLLSFLLNDLTD